MTYKINVIGGYKLRDMGDYRDGFKRILKLLEINSIYYYIENIKFPVYKV